MVQYHIASVGAIALCCLSMLQHSSLAKRVDQPKPDPRADVAKSRSGAPTAGSTIQDGSSSLQTQLGTKALAVTSVTRKNLEPSSQSTPVLRWLAMCAVCVSVGLTILSRMGMVAWRGSPAKWSPMTVASVGGISAADPPKAFLLKVFSVGADSASDSCGAVIDDLKEISPWLRGALPQMMSCFSGASRYFGCSSASAKPWQSFESSDDSSDWMLHPVEAPIDVSSEHGVELREKDPEAKLDEALEDAIGGFLAAKLSRSSMTPAL